MSNSFYQKYKEKWNGAIRLNPDGSISEDSMVPAEEFKASELYGSESLSMSEKELNDSQLMRIDMKVRSQLKNFDSQIHEKGLESLRDSGIQREIGTMEELEMIKLSKELQMETLGNLTGEESEKRKEYSEGESGTITEDGYYEADQMQVFDRRTTGTEETLQRQSHQDSELTSKRSTFRNPTRLEEVQGMGVLARASAPVKELKENGEDLMQINKESKLSASIEKEVVMERLSLKDFENLSSSKVSKNSEKVESIKQEKQSFKASVQDRTDIKKSNLNFLQSQEILEISSIKEKKAPETDTKKSEKTEQNLPQTKPPINKSNYSEEYFIKSQTNKKTNPVSKFTESQVQDLDQYNLSETESYHSEKLKQINLNEQTSSSTFKKKPNSGFKPKLDFLENLASDLINKTHSAPFQGTNSSISNKVEKKKKLLNECKSLDDQKMLGLDPETIDRQMKELAEEMRSAQKERGSESPVKREDLIKGKPGINGKFMSQQELIKEEDLVGQVSYHSEQLMFEEDLVKSNQPVNNIFVNEGMKGKKVQSLGRLIQTKGSKPKPEKLLEIEEHEASQSKTLEKPSSEMKNEEFLQEHGSSTFRKESSGNQTREEHLMIDESSLYKKIEALPASELMMDQESDEYEEEEDEEDEEDEEEEEQEDLEYNFENIRESNLMHGLPDDESGNGLYEHPELMEQSQYTEQYEAEEYRSGELEEGYEYQYEVDSQEQLTEDLEEEQKGAHQHQLIWNEDLYQEEEEDMAGEEDIQSERQNEESSGERDDSEKPEDLPSMSDTHFSNSIFQPMEQYKQSKVQQISDINNLVADSPAGEVEPRDHTDIYEDRERTFTTVKVNVSSETESNALQSKDENDSEFARQDDPTPESLEDEKLKNLEEHHSEVTENEEPFHFEEEKGITEEDNKVSENSSNVRTMPNFSDHQLMDNLSSLFPRNDRTSYSKIENNRSSYSVKDSCDQTRDKKRESTNFSFNQHATEEILARELRRSKSINDSKEVEKEIFKVDLNRFKADEESEESAGESLHKEPEAADMQLNQIKLTPLDQKPSPKKNSLVDVLTKKKSGEFEMVDNVVFSFMENKKHQPLFEPPRIEFKDPEIHVKKIPKSRTSVDSVEQIRDESVKTMTQGRNTRMSSELSYGNISVDAVENRIRNFGQIEVADPIEEVTESKEQNLEETRTYSKHRYSKSMNDSVFRNSVEIVDDQDEGVQSNQAKNESEQKPDESFSIMPNPEVLDTESKPESPAQPEEIPLETRVSAEIDYNYLSAPKNEKPIEQNVTKNLETHSNNTTPQYSIFDSKKQLSQSMGGDSSFKESECEVKISQNNKLSEGLPTPKNEMHKMENHSENIRDAPQSNWNKNFLKKNEGKFGKLEELTTAAKTNPDPDLVEMSFKNSKLAENLENSKEINFRKTIEELKLDSIMHRTQSLDNQSHGVVDLINSKASSKDQGTELKSRLGSFSSRFTEEDIIKNYEKLDPKGVILKKLIIKYQILTGRERVNGRKRAEQNRPDEK